MDGASFGSAYEQSAEHEFVSLPLSELGRPCDARSRSAPVCNTLESERVAELWMILGPAKFVTVVRLLAAELGEAPTEILHAAAGKNGMGRARILAHNLKTISDNFGVTGVARAAEGVELARPGFELDRALKQLDRHSTSARAALLDLLAAPTAAAHGFV